MNRYSIYTTLGLLLAGYMAAAQGIKIMPGTTFKLTGGPYTMVLAGNAGLQNQASLTMNNLILKATGTGSNNIGNTGTLSIGQLQLNKAAGESVVLQSPVHVAQGVYFNNGVLDLNGEDLVLADTAMLVNEGVASHVLPGSTGAIQISAVLDAPLAENPGNLGVIITSGANWGNTVIRRHHNAYTNAGGGSSILRNYEVTPANNTGLNAFLRFYYLDGELNSLNESTLDVFQSGNGGAQWTDIGAAGRNTTQNFVNVNGVQSMSLFTLSTIGNPLPVALNGFKAYCLRRQAVLQWRMDHPFPSDYFLVEKSRDGNAWEQLADKIAVVASAGYEYSYTDVGEAYAYYRLQCVHADGDISYSTVQQLNCTDADYTFSLLENPARSRITVEATMKAALTAAVKVYDMQGRLMSSRDEQLQAGISRFGCDVSALAAGMYQLQVTASSGILWQAKFVKE